MTEQNRGEGVGNVVTGKVKPQEPEWILAEEGVRISFHLLSWSVYPSYCFLTKKDSGVASHPCLGLCGYLRNLVVSISCHHPSFSGLVYVSDTILRTPREFWGNYSSPRDDVSTPIS